MRRRCWTLALALCLLLGGCAARGPAGGADLLLGAVYPLTGPQAAGGKDELAGVRTAVALVNTAGGWHGRPVRLAVEDAPTAAAGVAAVDDLVQRQHVPLIFGSYSSVVAVAASAEADRLRTIWWETGAVTDEVTTRHLPYVFRTVATGSSLGRASARFTAEVLAPRWQLAPAAARIVIVYEQDVYGASVAAGAEDEAARRGLHIGETIPYDAGSVDPNAVARQIAAAKPDFLWDASYLPDGVAIWRAVVASGVSLTGAVGTSSAFCMPEFGQELGPLATGLFASDKADSTINPDALSPAARALLDHARAAYAQREHRAMSIAAVAGFVGAWSLLHDVAPQASAFTPDAIRAAALAVDLPQGAEINGAGLQFAPVSAADGGQNIAAASVVWQWQPGGMRVVFPALYRTSEPQVVPVPQTRAPAPQAHAAA